MNFIGNQKTFNLLAKSLKNGQLNHAYIFSGPEHVGKFTLAKMFAFGAISGSELGKETDALNKNAQLDLLVIAPEISEKKGVSKMRDIPIESIRDAQKSLSLFPFQGKYKIMLIDEAQKMSTSAQNALLKMLEEPNPTTIIILVTSEVDRLLATVQSRCQTINFGLVGDEEILDFFPQNVVSLSAGRPGLAKIIIENKEEFDFRSEAILDFDKIVSGSINERLVLAEEFSKNIGKTLDKLNFWLWEMRKKAFLAKDFERRNLYAGMEKIETSMSVLKRTNANARLVLETLFLDI
jgi:DNA polymerase III subunit delta'